MKTAKEKDIKNYLTINEYEKMRLNKRIKELNKLRFRNSDDIHQPTENNKDCEIHKRGIK